MVFNLRGAFAYEVVTFGQSHGKHDENVHQYLQSV